MARELAQERKSPGVLTWFDRMEGSLSWRIIPPPINTPFSNPLPTSLLLTLLNYPAKLRGAFQLKCLCDGYEVLHINNLETPFLCTDNPCIASMESEELFQYLNRSNVLEQINEAIERARREIMDELDRREREAAQSRFAELKRRKKDSSKKREIPAPSPFRFRIVGRRRRA